MKTLAITIEWNEETKALRATAVAGGMLPRLPQKDVESTSSRQVADPIYGADFSEVGKVALRAMESLREQLNGYAAAESVLDKARELLGLPPEPLYWVAVDITDDRNQLYWFEDVEVAQAWHSEFSDQANLSFEARQPETPQWLPPVVAPTHWVGYAVADQNTQLFWFASEELAQQWLHAQDELEAVITIGQVAPGTPEWTGPATPGQGFSAWMVLQDIDLMTRHAVYYFPSQGEAVDYANALAQDIVDGPVDEQVVFGVVPAGVIEYPTDDGPVAWMARESDDSQHLWFENKALAVDWLRLQMELSLAMDFHLYFGRVHASTNPWVPSDDIYV